MLESVAKLSNILGAVVKRKNFMHTTQKQKIGLL